MEILFAMILLLLQNLWDFVSNNAGTTGLALVFIAFLADYLQTKSSVERLSFQVRNKVDKPREETPSEKFTRERREGLKESKNE